MEQKNANADMIDQQLAMPTALSTKCSSGPMGSTTDSQCHLLSGCHQLSMADVAQGFPALEKCLLPLLQMASAGKMVPSPSILSSVW